MVTSPIIDGSAAASFTAVNSGTVTLSTVQSNDVICVAIGAEQNGATPAVVSVTSPDLIFTRRGGVAFATNNSRIELWTAFSASPLSGEVITVNLSTNDACSLIAFGIQAVGSSTVSLDPNASLPAVSASASPVTVSLTTTNPSDLLIALTGNTTGLQSGTPAGFTTVLAKSATNIKTLVLKVMTKSVTVAQSAVPVATAGNGWTTLYVDAISALATASVEIQDLKYPPKIMGVIGSGMLK